MCVHMDVSIGMTYLCLHVCMCICMFCFIPICIIYMSHFPLVASSSIVVQYHAVYIDHFNIAFIDDVCMCVCTNCMFLGVLYLCKS